MGIDPIAAQFAKQNILEAKERAKAARRELEEESMRSRKTHDKFYGSLALFSGGTIALSITYLGYIRGAGGRSVLYPKVLVASWIVLLVCVITSLFSILLSGYYRHFGRLRIYVAALKENNETIAEEMDNLLIVNIKTKKEREEQKKIYTDKASVRSNDERWAKKRETFFGVLWNTVTWTARVTFPVGLGLLVFFASKNM